MNKPPLPSEILEHLDAIIVGQSEHKKRLAIGLYNHFFRLHSKSNVSEEFQGKQPNNFCIIGPDGDGKEKLFSTIAVAFRAPHIIYDCTEIKKFDVSQIATKLWESALLIHKDGVPIEVEIQRSIVFLDNFLLIHESLNPDLCDLAVHLHREFDAKDIKIQARNLLFVYVVFPVYRDASLMRRGSFYDYPNNMRKMMEETYSCIYLTTEEVDMVEISEPSNEIISKYRQDFALHNISLEFTREAILLMKKLNKNEINDILDKILSMAMWEIIGLDKNAVEVTLDSLEHRQCPRLYKKEM